jgi:hypothetical protein
VRDEENIDFSPGITEVYAQWLGQYWGRPAEELNIDVNPEDGKQGRASCFVKDVFAAAAGSCVDSDDCPGRAGWQIELGKEGCLWLCKVRPGWRNPVIWAPNSGTVVPSAQAWKDTGVVSSVHHTVNQLKRTWEVLRDEGTHSFKMEDNDKYKVCSCCCTFFLGDQTLQAVYDPVAACTSNASDCIPIGVARSAKVACQTMNVLSYSCQSKEGLATASVVSFSSVALSLLKQINVSVS